MRRLLTLLFGLFAVLVAGGCITDPVTGRSVVGMPTSEAEESQQGLAYRPVIVQEFGGPYPDRALEQYLGGIVLGMAKRSVRPDLPWTFTVLNTSVPNAFAVPGGQVFVTRGLLVELEDEAEFAVVMGHELGHVEHRHGARQQGQQLLLGAGIALAQAAAGDQWTEGVDQGAQLLAALGMSKYSRDDERESDARGVENSYTAGYDPRQGADVFRTFLRMKQESGGGGGPDWLSSHPADEERIQTILRLSAEKDARLGGSSAVPGLTVTTPAWGRLVAKLRDENRTYKAYDAEMAKIEQAKGSEASVRAAIPVFARCASELPGHATFHATLGKAYLVAGDAASARTALVRAANLNQNLFEPEYLLGALALDAKDWNGAVSHAERGLAILPDNYACLWVRGEAHWNAGRRDQAERDLRAVLQSAPKTSDEYKSAAGRLSGAAAPAAAPKRTTKR